MAAQLQQQKQPQFSHKPIEEMMKDLGVDSCVQLSDSDKVVYKDGSSSDVTSCISSAGDATCSLKESYVDHESPAPIHHLPYPPPAYCGYYYPGYDATFGGLNEHGYYIPPDALDFQYPVMQADNGSLIYLIPGMHPPMYNPYGPYSPVTVVGVDGQYVGPQPYSPGPVVQTSITSPGYLPTLPYSEFVPSAHLWDPSVFVEDQTYQNGHGKILEIPGSRTSISLPGHAHIPPSKNSLRSDFNNQLKTVSQHVITYQSDAQSKGYFQFAKFPSFNYGKGGMLHPTNNFKANTREWSGTEKPKSRSKVNSINDVDSHNEQNHAPRTTDAKVSLTFGGNAAALLGSTDQNGNSNSAVAVIRKDQYNLPDFSTKYDHAYFFVIKSYSEDDIHKSIKYNVWASTPNGNKRLDNAYQDAQNKLIEKGSKCPVFLFFSVNASGQFCGVAEMIGQVDFNKSMDFWQQNKWTGYFPVKWHIIKDVPNPQLRQIILENNENKPVTNSRDTQEVRYPQGIEMLNIFKNYVSKTSLLDDFEFYESRQKVMQEKKLRPLMLHSDYKQKSDGLASGVQAEDVSTEQMKIMKETQAGYKAKE